MPEFPADHFKNEPCVSSSPKPRSIDDILIKYKEAAARVNIVIRAVQDSLDFLLSDGQKSLEDFDWKIWRLVCASQTEADKEALIGGLEELNARITHREGKFVFASDSLADAYRTVISGYIKRLKEIP